MGRNKITRALIVDFDLHFGDGTSNTFCEDPTVVYHHMGSEPGELERFLSNVGMFDIVGVSTGFDRGLVDWGHAQRWRFPENWWISETLLRREYLREAIRGARGRVQPRCSWSIDSQLFERIRIAEEGRTPEKASLLFCSSHSCTAT